jgi:hypothetical protein
MASVHPFMMNEYSLSSDVNFLFFLYIASCQVEIIPIIYDVKPVELSGGRKSERQN